MRRFILTATACAVLSAGATARAQLSDAQAQELQRQLEALKQQLQGTVKNEPQSPRVTDIGGTRGRSREPEVAVRIYDISDMFQVAPPYFAEFQGDLGDYGAHRMFETGGAVGATSGMGGMGGGGFFGVKDQPRRLPAAEHQTLHQIGGKKDDVDAAASGRVTADSLIGVIRETIAPESWSANGGTATIVPLGNSLVVSAEPAAHAQIESLLALFRQRWGTLRTISLRANWLYLSDSQLAKMLAPEAPAKEGEPRGYGIVGAAAWQQVFAELEQAEAKLPSYRAAVTCYNGQTVHALAGDQSLAVTQFSPEFAATSESSTNAGRAAYRPTVSVLQEGAALQVRPSATYSGKYVVLDVHSRVGKLGAVAKPVVAVKSAGEVAPADVAAALDRPNLLIQRLSTTLRVPVDRPTLVGGMTFSGQPKPGEPTLYLFVTVSVQELRDDQPAVSEPAPQQGKELAPPAG